MKCALAQPAWDLSESHSEAMRSTVAGTWPPPGIMSIAAVLRQAGHEVTILDGTLLEQEEILDGIDKTRPDFLGISAVALIWPQAKELATKVKESFPDIYIAVGGPGPSFLGEKCIEECPAVDAVCFGEGEYTARELLHRLQNNESLNGLEGTILNTNNGIIHNPARPFIKDLDELPFPALDLVEIHKYDPPAGHYCRLPIAQMMATRGCPRSCLYCYKINGNSARVRSAKNVVDEMQYYQEKFQVKEIKFWDDLFTYNKERVLEICEEIRRRALNLIWSCASRADTINEELIKNMASAGCWSILYGIESAVPKNQKTIRKNLDLKKAEQTIKLTHKYGIKSFATFILGIPGETYDEAVQTIRYAKKINAHFTEFFTFTPFPGSPVYNDIERYGNMSENIADIGMHRMGFIPYSMTREELSKLWSLAYKTVYLNPRYIIRHIFGVRSWTDVRDMYRGALGVSQMLFKGHE